MNELKIFENEKFGKIRTIIIDGEPWFVGKDVATALGYSDTKSALADHVDPEDKRIIQRGQIATLDIPNRGLTIINEAGVYSLVFGSKLPDAKIFKRWIAHDVLPSIHKTGQYIEGVDMSLASPDIIVLQQMVTKLARQDIEQKRQAMQIQALEDQFSNTKEEFSHQVNGIRELIGTHPDNWREDCRKLIAKMAYREGGSQNIAAVNTLIYAQVNSRAGVNLNTRLNNLRKRAIENGASKTAVDKLNIVDVIAQDKKLIEIYVKVVREMAVQYDYE